jgi:hypothetical protein
MPPQYRETFSVEFAFSHFSVVLKCYSVSAGDHLDCQVVFKIAENNLHGRPPFLMRIKAPRLSKSSCADEKTNNRKKFTAKSFA